MNIPMEKIFFKTNIILFGIIIFAALLRIPFLDRFPPALYSDEVNQAYNAYSILKTGHDEHGQLLPISFRSFGDWKPPLQTYLMVPTIALFGLDPYGVRLPSAILGTVTVGLVYLLVFELFGSHKEKRHVAKIALLSSLFLAISPWHIHQSRAAMLIAIELFFFTAAVLTFLKALKNPRWFIASAVFWAGGIYSYYGMRLIAPLFVGFLAIFYRAAIKWKSRELWLSVFSGLLLLLPLLVSFVNNPDVVFGRAKTVSVFYDKGARLRIWEAETQDGQQNVSMLTTRAFHNKPVVYTLDILRRFLSHLDGRFLFLIGDTSLPFQIPNMGVLYLIDGLFLIVGLGVAIREKQNWQLLMLWIIVSILPASLSYLTPSANRSFTAIVPFMIFIAYGAAIIVRKISYQLIGKLIIAVGYGVSFMYFAYQYTVVLPRDHADWWYFGYKELVSYLNTQSDYEEIVVSGKLSVPYIYFLFFNRTDPVVVQGGLRRDLRSDEFGFEHVAAFGRYRFPRDFSWEKEYGRLSTKSLLVVTPAENVGKEAVLEKTIQYPNGRDAYRIYRIEKE